MANMSASFSTESREGDMNQVRTARALLFWRRCCFSERCRAAVRMWRC